MTTTYPISTRTTGDLITAAIWDNDVVGVGNDTPAAKAVAAGDVFYATAAGVITRLAKGTAMQILRMNAGATAPEWGTLAAVFGTGADGALHVTSGTTTIGVDKNYTDVTVDVGTVLVINSGITVRFTGTLTNNGTVRSNGGAGSDGTASTGGPGGSGPGGGTGGTGGGPNTSGLAGNPNSYAQPGMGGPPGGLSAFRVPGIGGLGRTSGTGGSGGNGGFGGATAAGGGGQGGGRMRLVGPLITGTGAFEAKGGTGGGGYPTTGGNGGDGGGGGLIETLTAEALGGSLTWAVTAGAAGTGVAPGGNGAAGTDGAEIHIVLTSATG